MFDGTLRLIFGPLLWALYRTWIQRATGIVEFIPILVGVGAAAAFIIFDAMRKSPAARRTLAHTLLEEGICPSCEYNFAGLETSGEAAQVICPECGATWNRSRILRAAPIVERAPAGLPDVDPLKYLGATLTSTWDDAGRGSCVQPYTLNEALRWSLDDAHRARLTAIRKMLAHQGRVRRLALGLVAVGITVAPFLLLRRYLPPGSDVTAILFLCIIIPFVWYGSTGRGGARRLKRSLKSVGVCPACGEDLSPIRRDDNGLNTCPTCRSAWRMPPQPDT
jgi:Zn-finger nucleic acid-binding protein